MDAKEERMWFIRSVLDDLPWYMDGVDAIALASRESQGSVHLHDAAGYIWDYARRYGWGIPAYPMDPAGEVREFLRDQGVRNVRAWYERIGVDAAAYDHLVDFRLLVVRRSDFKRQALLLPAGAFDRFSSQYASAQGQLIDSARYALDVVLGRTDEMRQVLYS